MSNFINRRSGKDNIKIIIMAGLAVVLIFILAHRFFGGQGENDAASAAHTHEDSLKSDTLTAALKLSPANSKPPEFGGLEPPPFLGRDIFSSGDTVYNRKGKAGETEYEGLQLKATIIDDRGALAIIDDDVLRIGEFIKGLQVRTIKNNEVMLSRGEKNYTMSVIKE